MIIALVDPLLFSPQLPGHNHVLVKVVLFSSEYA
jgi:hypothetical protein